MMTDPDPGTDRAGRRAKRFLTPLQKYEIFLQLVRQEVTMADAVEAIAVAARAASMRLGPVPPWSFASAASGGRLLSNTGSPYRSAA